MPDNGLTAAAYTSLGQIDPLVTEPVLAALAEAGIAAYTRTPTTPPPTPATPEDTTPSTDSPAPADPSTNSPTPADPSTESPAPATPHGASHSTDSSGPAGIHFTDSSGPPSSQGGSVTSPDAAASTDDPSTAGPHPAEEPLSGQGAPPDVPTSPSRPASKPARPADVPLEPTSEREAAVKAAAHDREAAAAGDREAAVKPGEREIPVPAGREEIFVDSEQVDKARPVIARSTEDAEWKSLVEQFNAPSAPGHDTPVPRWPASEDVDENSYEPLIDVPAGMDRTEEAPEPEPVRRRRDDDPHDHFIPPEPPRGPKLDWISRLAWLSLIGGPLLLLVAAIFDLGLGRLAALAVAGFVGGFLTLVFRMKDRLPQDDTPDDGAVV